MDWVTQGMNTMGPDTIQDLWYWTLSLKRPILFLRISVMVSLLRQRSRVAKIILFEAYDIHESLWENAVRYWLNKENIDQSRLLVVSDDVALPLGAFRLKGNGSNGGHNGLGHIQQLIGQNYARLRMGVGNDYPRGGQVDWVLGRYSDEEMKELQPAIDLGVDIIKSFALAGLDITMNQFNKLGKK